MNQLIEGQPVYVQGSGKKPYVLEDKGGVFSCTCPAWRNQSVPIDRRTCKHLKAHLGATEEEARCNGVTASAEREQEILSRSAGRKLRPDEKAKLNGPPVMLAHPYDPEVDPAGWWCSEKLDGVRAYWNGEFFISRQGNIFHAPEWFKKGLPKHPLDGELWMGRRCFEKTMGVVRRLDGGEAWRSVLYVVFDFPGDGVFEERIEKAKAAIVEAPYAFLLGNSRLTDRPSLFSMLEGITRIGGEGLMIRKPGSLYAYGKRSHDLLKVKPFKDAEATVVGYEPGKGRHKGRVGALTVMLPDGKTFELGTGLSDKDRESPPPIGCKVTYSYTELTNKGIPKCAAFVRVRLEE